MKQKLYWNDSEATAIEKAQIAFVQQGRAPDAHVVKELIQGQHATGGFEGFWTSGQPAIDPTCDRLANLQMLGLLHFPQARAAADFLQRNWTGTPEACELLGHLPPWLAPSEHSTLYLKANSAFHLSLQQREVHPEVLQDLQAAGLNLGFWQTFWLVASLQHRLGNFVLFEQISAHMENQLSSFEEEDLIWLCEAYFAAGVPAEHGLVRAAFSLLLAKHPGQTRSSRVYRLFLLSHQA
ncbi:hypothetical protein [Deinococcus cellulosilyticus]|nr:hypothetical protein [Deinococcus cellulosilyticus]